MSVGRGCVYVCVCGGVVIWEGGGGMEKGAPRRCNYLDPTTTWEIFLRKGCLGKKHHKRTSDWFMSADPHHYPACLVWIALGDIHGYAPRCPLELLTRLHNIRSSSKHPSCGDDTCGAGSKHCPTPQRPPCFLAV